ncbi:MAG: zinc ABC transporter substrate-binding protein [Candidatus Thiodiazotropha sp. 4PDIVS1]
MKHISLNSTLFALLLALSLFSAPSLAGLKVVVTIMPIHSLISGLMSGVGEPYLLLKSNQSPHTMSLKPSDARALNQADLVVWIGESLESPLSNLIKQLKVSSEVISLLDTPNLHQLPIRNNREWTRHHKPTKSSSTHTHEINMDNHIWLSPANARLITHHLSNVLIWLDPDNRGLYQNNLEKVLNRLDGMETQFKANISGNTDSPFIVFHDAYQYLEHHFGLNAVGSVSISPDRLAGAKHIHQLREKIRRLEARCIFSEPQFEPKLVHTLISGTQASAGELDPLGGGLTPGEDAYFNLMIGLSEGLASCLGNDQ